MDGKTFKHGLSGYTNKACRCDVCGSAYRDYRRSSRGEMVRHLRDELRRNSKPHGTITKYLRGCRCDECKHAQRLNYAARKAKRSNADVRVRPMSKIDKIVSISKRGGKIEGELLDMRGMTTDDIALLKECFVDVYAGGVS